KCRTERAADEHVAAIVTSAKYTQFGGGGRQGELGAPHHVPCGHVVGACRVQQSACHRAGERTCGVTRRKRDVRFADDAFLAAQVESMWVAGVWPRSLDERFGGIGYHERGHQGLALDDQGLFEFTVEAGRK